MNRAAICLIILVLAISAGVAQAQQGSYAVVIDLKNGEHIYDVGDKALFDKPTPPGSTIKTFVALAAIRNGFPDGAKIVCPSLSPAVKPEERCWLAKGHGPLAIQQGIAQSCAVYFRNLVRNTPNQDIYKLLVQYDLVKQGAHDPGKLTEDDFIGLTDKIRISPEKLFSGYRKAFADPRRLAMEDVIVRGLREAALSGTFAKVQAKYPDLKVYGKTGTAPMPEGEGKWQGLFVGFYPYPNPKYGVIAIVKNGTGGKDAAPLAFEVLQKAMSDKVAPSP